MASPDNNTDKILKSIDGLGKLQAPAFFYTRLQARLEKELLNEPEPFFLLRPAFLSGCLALALAFNIIALLNNQSPKTGETNPATGIDNFAREFNMNTAAALYQ